MLLTATGRMRTHGLHGVVRACAAVPNSPGSSASRPARQAAGPASARPALATRMRRRSKYATWRRPSNPSGGTPAAPGEQCITPWMGASALSRTSGRIERRACPGHHDTHSGRCPPDSAETAALLRLHVRGIRGIGMLIVIGIKQGQSSIRWGAPHCSGSRSTARSLLQAGRHRGALRPERPRRAGPPVTETLQRRAPQRPHLR